MAHTDFDRCHGSCFIQVVLLLHVTLVELAVPPSLMQLHMNCRSIQRFFARISGERDYPVYEAVPVGLGPPPLVVPLLPVVSLNIGGTCALKPREALKDASLDAPVHYDSKLDKLDRRREHMPSISLFHRLRLHPSQQVAENTAAECCIIRK